ncbi:hypothetical protein GCM10009677_08690 [Sphaerisporangium rubeum]|uniref:Uncharacterized protein n=1 Tax=Sphaerisporangium rubeum TaxID=321317 RepID=A0A7X0IK07_9ACTN|nr:hypothetical protein [Sphaerisporangium rubeum]MBB6476624.1 hypothetical protein [Sphaerisporangium rubeum]
MYAFSSINALETAARRIAILYWEMVQEQWLPDAVPEPQEATALIPEQRTSAESGCADD